MTIDNETIKTCVAIGGLVVVTVAGIMTGHDGALLNSSLLMLAGLGGYFGGRRPKTD